MSSLDEVAMLSTCNFALALAITAVERKIRSKFKVRDVSSGTIYERMAAGGTDKVDGFRKFYLKMGRGDLPAVQLLKQCELAITTNESKQKSIFLQMYVL